MDLNANLRSSGLHGTEVFEVHVPAGGILAVEATVPAGAAARPKLAFLDSDCRPATVGPGVIERYVSGMVVETSAAETYRFAVAPQNPVASLEAYEIVTRFVSWAELCSGTGLKSNVEPEVEPDLGTVCWMKTSVEPELEQDLLGLTVVGLCAKGGDDGDGGALACATRIGLGETFAGRLSAVRNAEAFKFTLGLQTTVAIEVATEGDLSLGVYDGSGHLLDLEDLDGEANHLYVATLAPGAYHVRLDHAGAGAGYRLTVTDAGW